MATNLSRNRVVNPARVDDFRTVAFAHGSVIFVSGLVLAVQAAFHSRFYPAGSNGSVLILAAGALALLLGTVFGIVFAVKNRRRKLALSLPLKPLREVASFDAKTVSNETLWVAAGLAATDPEEARRLIEADTVAAAEDGFFPLNDRTAAPISTDADPFTAPIETQGTDAEFFALEEAPATVGANTDG